MKLSLNTLKLSLFFLFLLISFRSEALEKYEDYFKNSSLGVVQSKSSEHFQVSWVNPKDEVIADALLFQMESARKLLEKDFAQAMSAEKVPVEIFPDLKTFSDVSQLSLARFRATGTIALTLEQRLMILSPRNLVTGYNWGETVVHEYIHYLIRRISANAIPIWLHEGVAQVYQGYPYHLQAALKPSQWGLFDKSRKAGKLLDLRTLQEPFPYRKTPEEAELAYVQALLFAQWLNKQCGVVQLIQYAEKFQSVGPALEKCTNRSYEELKKDFLPKIMGEIKVPESEKVEFYARSFDSSDPVETEGERADKEAQNLATLSNELFNQGRYRASGIEMKKALNKTPVSPPSWRLHLAKTYLKNQKDDDALRVLNDLTKDYPDDAGAWYLMGVIDRQKDKLKLAWQSFLRAFYVNPFLDDLQTQMAELTNLKPEFKDRFLKEDLPK